MRASDAPRSGALPAYALFTLSGAAGLVFETVFLRQFVWLYGSGASATAIVLASFMAGLALGAALFGPVADRTPHPLRLYGVLELAAAATGAGLVWLLGSGRHLLLDVLRAVPPGPPQMLVERAGGFLLVLVPSACMGGTLPALGRFVIRDMRRFVGSLGLLYGLNTCGAAAGVFVSGFFLFEGVGISASAYLAALLLGLVGVAALALDRATAPSGVADEGVDAPVPAGASGAEGPSRPATLAIAVAATSGFVVLGFEVAWTRLLSLFMRSFSYSFSLMLSLFLVGLCAGAILLAALGPRLRDPVRVLGFLLAASAAYVALSLIWLPWALAPIEASSFVGFLASATVRAACIVVPVTLLSGMVLPLAARAVASHARRVGRDLGRVYAANTVGAILGALAAGLVLLPALGAPWTLAVLAALEAAAGWLVLASCRVRGRAGLALVLLVVCLAPLVRGGERFVQAFLDASIGRERIGELLFFHEGANDTIAVVGKDYGFLDPTAKSLITNGVAMSGTVKPIWRYMALEGHLPVLLASRPERALAVGIGTGITLSALVAHPGLDSITAVELSDGVLLALDRFAEDNDRAHRDPRVRLVHGDGRHYLERSAERFDVITVEPPPPIVSGSVHLYSLDFYRLCLERLSEGGVVAQWLPLHAQSLESARMTASTFLAAFPHVALWLPSARDAVLVGSPRALRLDLRRLDAAYAEARTRAHLIRAYLETPESLLATYLLGRSGLESWAADAPVITDERPLMEFFRRQGGNMQDRDIAGLLAEPQGDWAFVDGLEREPDRIERIRTGNRALRLYLLPIRENAAPARQAASLDAGTDFFLYRYGCAGPQIEGLLASRAETEVRSHVEHCARLRSGLDPGVPGEAGPDAP